MDKTVLCKITREQQVEGKQPENEDFAGLVCELQHTTSNIIPHYSVHCAREDCWTRNKVEKHNQEILENMLLMDSRRVQYIHSYPG